MPLRQDFERDVPRFLAEHALLVNGGNLNAELDGSTIGQLLGAAQFQTTQKAGGGDAKSGVSLVAPLMRAELEPTLPATHLNYFDFSVPTITAKLGAFGGGDMPVYLIPYEGRTGRGVKLPAHGSDPYPIAYAMTATQNGCTVEVSGDATSPYASHTNVIDVDGDSEGERWRAREQKINLRLFRLQQRFAAAETLAGGDATAPARNRKQFGFYGPTGANAIPATDFTSYQRVSEGAVESIAGHDIKTLGRTDDRFGHDRFYAVPTDQTVDDARDRSASPMALVVGRRTATGWTFYFQVWRPMTFNVKRVPKMGGTKLGDGKFIMQDQAPTKRVRYSVTAVLASGELWPNPSEQQCTFGGGI